VPSESSAALTEALKQSAAALRRAGVPFLLGGGLACWARGGPQTDHDVDLFVRPGDAEAALAALAAAGMRTEHPPEDWLYKAWTADGALVDVIFAPSGGPVGDEHFARAEEREVVSTRMLVASLEDVLTTKLLALTEQEPDYGSVLELARALREQVDWAAVRAHTERSPFARAFFTLVEGLGIVEPVAAG
jgi:hypothetical protein